MTEPEHLSGVELYPPWREAEERFFRDGWKYGDVIPHEWFWQAFGLEKPPKDMPLGEAERQTFLYLKQMDPFRAAMLEDHQIDLVNERNVGYMVVLPKDQTKLAYEDGVREVRKALKRMGRRLSYVDLAQLTAEERRQNADALARLAMLRGMIRQARHPLPLDGPHENGE